MLQVGGGPGGFSHTGFRGLCPEWCPVIHQVGEVRRADWWGKGKGEKQRGDRCSKWAEAKGVSRADWWVQGKADRRSGDSCSRLKGSGGQTGGGNVKGEGKGVTNILPHARPPEGVGGFSKVSDISKINIFKHFYVQKDERFMLICMAFYIICIFCIFCIFYTLLRATHPN